MTTPRSFGRLTLTDLLGAGSSDAVAIDERPAMQGCTDDLFAVFDAAGGEPRGLDEINSHS
ncbi:MAG: hypothetical protein VYA67_08435 [Actinomycetota bacterium]|uniref:Uncharacterized protein n=1 Tax=Mycobacterium lentiflavum TaxID=141349 RepID=A0ABY3UUR8_MYCLN|nr:hypothetical protein [Mycobacterium lentiflavum]MEE3063985.1 hypothetical protein [Actinomycetota bacterium]ULP40769.1 hypothetical protein MJO58_17735 [Mycobacterium lentiflavum]